jgi:hypothetical protein
LSMPTAMNLVLVQDTTSATPTGARADADLHRLTPARHTPCAPRSYRSSRSPS